MYRIFVIVAEIVTLIFAPQESLESRNLLLGISIPFIFHYFFYWYTAMSFEVNKIGNLQQYRSDLGDDQ